MLILLITVVTFCGFLNASPLDLNACEIPSRWCESYSTALKCGLYEYCQETAWKESPKGAISDQSMHHGDDSIVTPVSIVTATPVTVTLYFESLCPGCRQFINTQAYPAYQKLANTGILDLKFVPYGNAQEYPYGSTYTYRCQHGPTECEGNKVEACAIHQYPSQAQYVPFIHCVEYYGFSVTNAQYCAGQEKLDWTTIYACATGTEGTALMHEMATQTGALNPRHQYVPWITVNGAHTDAVQTAIMNNMVQYVCSVYQGTKPAACSQQHDNKVCYRDD